MPNGKRNPAAKMELLIGFPLLLMPLRIRTRLAWLSETKISPFGAVAIARGSCRPATYSATVKPAGAFGQAPFGLGTTFSPRSTERVTKGFGRSDGVIRRRTSGAAVF